MYRIIKVLNNNGILVYHNETGRELILMGNGVGFGKKPTQQIEDMPGAKVYSLVTRQKQQSVLKVVNGIQPGFIEAAGRIIEEAEKVFSEVNHEILLPMADHIALAAKRAKALHIHAGLSDEQVSVTLDTTRIINEGIRMIEKGFSRKLQEDSLAYTRLMSHLYYMVARTRNGESTKVDFNDFIFTNYPETGRVAEMVCSYMGNELKKPVAKEEIGFLAIHIQRVISPETL